MFEKLIRDRIPAIALAEGRLLPTRIAEAKELRQFLVRKLFEEALEVAEATTSSDRDRILDELADVKTVLDHLAQHQGIDQEEIESRARDKLQERGGFKSGIILQDATHSGGRIHVGSGESLLDSLKTELAICIRARFAVAFVMESGLDLLEGALRSALLRSAQIEFLTTDYLGVTEPEALERLLNWPGSLAVKVFTHPWRSFHPKAYLLSAQTVQGAPSLVRPICRGWDLGTVWNGHGRCSTSIQATRWLN